MKKLFNYALLAAALLVGVNVNAANDCTVKIGSGQPQAANFVDVLTNINGADYIGQTVVITLTDNITIQNPAGGKFYDFNIFPGKTYTIDVTIDMNGKNIVGAPETFYRIRIFKGKLTFTGKGVIEEISSSTKNDYASAGVLYVAGTGDDVPETYAELIVDKDVTIVSPMSYGVGLLHASYGSSVSGESKSNVSNGAVLTVKGTINANTPVTTNGTMNYVEDVNNPTSPFINTLQPPVINIESTAVLIGNHDEEHLSAAEQTKYKTEIEAAGYSVTEYMSTSTCLYAPGYAIYNIAGRIEGGIGIYAKGGKLNLNGAVVKATSEHYFKPIAYGNGCIGAGSAIVLDSHTGYGQFDGMSITNSTIVSDNGYAIEELATKGQTKLPDIDVNSGTFVGGQGAISTTAEEREKIKDEGSIGGGEWHNTDVTPYLDPNKNTVLEFADSEGKHYQVVVPISKDEMENSIAAAAAKEAGERYAYIQENVNPEVVDVDRTIDFLLVDSAATVIVKSGVVLDAGTLMTEGSQIAGKGTGKVIVEAGGTLIISGEQGAYTYDENSLVIETSEANSGIVLINPAVVLNTTPKATIKFISKAWRTNADEKEYQYFGAPTVGGVIKKIVANPATYKTQLDVWNGTGWSEVGIMDGNDDSQLNYDVFNCAFGFYSILSTNPKGEGNRITYTFSGNLYGNSNPKVAVEKGWAPMSNGFTGIMDGEEMLNALENTGVDEVVYTPTQTISGHLQWTGHTGLRYLEEVKPMDVFMLRNNANKNELTLNYKDLVWSPATEEDEGSKAPKANNFAVATVRVDGCGMNDIVTVAEDNVFSADFDNRYDAEKYNNEDIRFYVNADKAYDIYATDNLNNTFVGLMTTKAGKYTISFENVTGNFDLIDNKTNARIAMAEGTTYEFLAEAGEDAYRFTIVAGAQAPTDMQKTNAAVKTTKALINNQIVISNGERFFNVLGTEVK